MHFPTSLNSEDGNSGGGKSEAPIVAMNAGNAAGAKGRRFEITNRGNRPRHRADSAHDNRTYSFHTVGAASAASTVQRIDGTAKQSRRSDGQLRSPTGQ